MTATGSVYVSVRFNIIADLVVVESLPFYSMKILCVSKNLDFFKINYISSVLPGIDIRPVSSSGPNSKCCSETSMLCRNWSQLNDKIFILQYTFV